MNLRKAIASAESQQLDMEQSLKDSGTGKGIGGSGYAEHGGSGLTDDVDNPYNNEQALDTTDLAEDIKLDQISMHEALDIAQECFGLDEDKLKVFAAKITAAQRKQ